MATPNPTLEECLSRIEDAIRLDPESSFAVKAKKKLLPVLGEVPDCYTPTPITYEG